MKLFLVPGSDNTCVFQTSEGGWEFLPDTEGHFSAHLLCLKFTTLIIFSLITLNIVRAPIGSVAFEEGSGIGFVVKTMWEQMIKRYGLTVILLILSNIQKTRIKIPPKKTKQKPYISNNETFRDTTQASANTVQ